MTKYAEEYGIMSKYFGKDNLLSLATLDGDRQYVRCLDAYFDGGSFYAISYALSEKIKQTEVNPNVAFCSPDWLTGHGTAKNLGYIYNEENLPVAEKLKKAFAAWYDNGHNDYEDRNTIILEIKVTDCVFFHEGNIVSYTFE